MDMEIDGGAGESAKRRKTEGASSNSNGKEDEMRRVAEIVLVLSAMGRMRGGKDPTEAEKAVMAEARSKVAALCEELAPKDVVPKEVFGGLIEDLGLNKLKDQRLGFRTPKLSISDKISLTKRRMEESKAFSAQPSLSTPQRAYPVSGATGENLGTPPARVFSADKVGHIPVSSGNFQPPTSVVQPPTSVVQPKSVVQPAAPVKVSQSVPTPLPLHPSGADGRPTVASSAVPSNIGKNSASLVPPRADRAHIRPDGRSNVSSSVAPIPVSSAAGHHTMRPGPAHIQPQAASRVNVVAQGKAPDQLPVRAGNTGASQMTVQPAVGQPVKQVVIQGVPGTVPTAHHPMQGVQYVHPPIVSHHLEISKVVQRLLNQSVPQRPAWTPPSRDYMNKALPCQFCKLIINEVENVVVCDACEKAYHLACLQSYNTKGIPRGEWHCPRCLSMSHGKPFPPKYGRVTRNMNAPKGPSDAALSQFPSDKKMETGNEKLIPSNAVTRSRDVRTQAQAVKVTESSSESNLPHGNEADRSIVPVALKKEEGHDSEKCPKSTRGIAIDVFASTSTGSSCDKPQGVVKSEVSHPDDGFMSETESSTPINPQFNKTSENLPEPSNQNNFGQKVSNGVGNSIVQHSVSNGDVDSHRRCNKESSEKDSAQQVLIEADRIQDQVVELVVDSTSGLHSVDWIGDIDRVVGGKKYFRSCRIEGAVYQVQDYALVRLGNGKLTPVRLQDMWEGSQTSSKWLSVHKCYFPNDLPEEVGRPGAPQSNEVYESIHDSNVLAGFIQGPCEVLPFRKFGEETESSDQVSHAKDERRPVFIRNWFYDESKSAFCPSAS